MGKLKNLLIEIDTIIEEETEKGWDYAIEAFYDAKDNTTVYIIESLEKLANKYNLEFEDLEVLFQDETIHHKIEDSIENHWNL